MSKSLLVLIIAVAVGLAISRKERSDAAAATTSGHAAKAEAVEVAEAKPTVLGKIGIRLVEGPVQRMSANTQHTIRAIGPALKRTGGANGKRAMDAAKKATALDRESLDALAKAHPVKAVRAAIDARNFANVAKGILGVEIAQNGP